MPQKKINEASKKEDSDYEEPLDSYNSDSKEELEEKKESKSCVDFDYETARKNENVMLKDLSFEAVFQTMIVRAKRDKNPLIWEYLESILRRMNNEYAPRFTKPFRGRGGSSFRGRESHQDFSGFRSDRRNQDYENESSHKSYEGEFNHRSESNNRSYNNPNNSNNSNNSKRTSYGRGKSF